jgi:hypothetical protein
VDLCEGLNLRCVRWFAACCLALACLCAPADASASPNLSFRAPGSVRAGSLATFSGRVLGGAGDLAVVQRRVRRQWRALVGGVPNARGRFVLTWPAPTKRGKLMVRAVLSSAHGMVATSRARTLRVLAAKKGSALVTVPSRDQVLDPSVVSSLPAPGRAGMLRYAGGNQLRAGQIIAIGQGPSTPNGFLGRATKVVTRNGQTVVSTVPATLLDAVPSGTLDVTMTTHATADARAARRAFARAAAASVACKGKASWSIKPSPSFHAPSITLKGSWKLFGGLQSASLTADANESAGITATVQGQGSCTLAKTPVLSFPGPSVDTFVGPIPVVLTSKITVYLDAAAAINASATASASVGFSASAGIAWAKGRGFYPIQTFTPHLGFTPPSLSADGSVAANLTPTLDVLLYGVVGPQLALKGGLALGANIHQNPWWTLTAPVDLTASIAIPPLKLTSPTLHVYQRTFHLADAGGPFGGGGGGGGSVTVTGPGDQTNTVGTPVSLQIQATDTDGGALTYSATGLPAGLSMNSATGLISRTPTIAGSSSVTVNAKDATGPTGSTSFNWVVTPGEGGAQVAAGAGHSCALLTTRQVDCWGSNYYGELGNGTTTASSVPVQVSDITNATQITAGYGHACALLATGQSTAGASTATGS